MYMNGGVQAYRQTGVMTADPKRLILMCYEGAIDCLRAAKDKLIAKDFEGKGYDLNKARDIIGELTNSLDFEKGDEIARNLDSIYNYMLRRILHADMEKDARAVDEVVGLLSELKTAWEEIPADAGGENSAESHPAFNEKNTAPAAARISA